MKFGILNVSNFFFLLKYSVTQKLNGKIKYFSLNLYCILIFSTTKIVYGKIKQQLNCNNFSKYSYQVPLDLTFRYKFIELSRLIEKN